MGISNHNLSTAQANLKLALWNADASAVNGTELYVELHQLNLPDAVTSQLHEFIYTTKEIAGKVINIGKIVILKILDFIKAHPFLVTGMAIGAVIGSVIGSLITSVPLLGPILSPIALALGITITAAGVVIGHRLDKQFQEVGQDIGEIIQEFFSLFVDVFRTVIYATI